LVSIFFIPVNSLLLYFSPQFKVAGLVGRAFDMGLFLDILKNNLLILFVCFVLSVVYGAGSILFIAWNASVWGVFFGYAISSSLGTGSFIGTFMSIITPILPHLVTESFAYFTAAVIGGVLSKALIREKLFSKKFNHILGDSMILGFMGFLIIVLAAYVEVSFPILPPFLRRSFYGFIFLSAIGLYIWLYFGKNHYFHHNAKHLIDPLVVADMEHDMGLEDRSSSLNNRKLLEKELLEDGDISIDEARGFDKVLDDEKAVLGVKKKKVSKKKKIVKKKVSSVVKKKVVKRVKKK